MNGLESVYPFQHGNRWMTPDNIDYITQKDLPQTLARMMQHVVENREQLGNLSEVIHLLVDFLGRGMRPPMSHPRYLPPADSSGPEEVAATMDEGEPEEPIEPPPFQDIAAWASREDVGSLPPSEHIEVEVQSLHHRFQAVLAATVETPAKLKRRSEVLRSIASAFQGITLPLVKIIVEEQGWADEDKSIVPLSSGGSLYFFGGVLFHLTTNSSGVNAAGSRDHAMKLLSHEWKAACAILGANIPNLHIPLSMAVKYLGHGVWVSAQPPVSPEGLAYGSLDGGQTVVKASVQLSGLMKRLAEVLNLKGHRVGKASSKYIYGPADVQGYVHRDDGRHYLLKLNRLMPPEAPGPDRKVERLAHLLRPEAVRVHVDPLSSDTYSPFDTSTESEEDITSASQMVVDHLLPDLAQTLVVLQERMKLTGEDVVVQAHRIGVNCRHLGKLLPHLPESSTLSQTVLVELVARSFRTVLFDRWAAKVVEEDVPPTETARLALEAFHDVLDPAREGEAWQVAVRGYMATKFGVHGTNIHALPRSELFQRCCWLTGVYFSLANEGTFEEFSHLGPADKSSGGQSVEITALCKPVGVPTWSPPEQLTVDGRLEEAAVMYDKSVQRLEAVLDPRHPSLIPHLRGAAQVFAAMGNKDVMAEALYKRVVSIREADEGHEDPCTIEALRELSDFYVQQNRYDAAYQSLQRCLEAATTAFGGDHPLIPPLLNQMGMLQYWRGHFGAAIQAYQRAMFNREKFFGFDHPVVADSLIHMGLFHSKQNNPSEAIPLFQRALSILKEHTPSVVHPEVGKATYHLAVALFNSSRLEESETLFRRCHPILEACYGSDDPLTASCIAYAERAASGREPALVLTGPEQEELHRLLNSQKFAEAIPLYRKFVAIQERELGGSSAEFAALLTQLGHAYLHARSPEAVDVYTRAVTIKEKVYGEGHPNVADALGSLATAYETLGDFQNAITTARRAVELWEASGKNQHPMMSSSLDMLGRLDN